jgi:hypothetical protein
MNGLRVSVFGILVGVVQWDLILSAIFIEAEKTPPNNTTQWVALLKDPMCQIDPPLSWSD